MSAFYFIDKPIGITSFDVVKIFRKKLNIKKIGHTGTLDPLATGGLLVAVGNYTKLIPFFEKDFKIYEFEVDFSGTSPSFDLGTEIEYFKEIKDLEKNITKEKILEALKNNFSGEISQIPPKYSALKINGKKALNKVLDGEEFELKPRKCFIYEIELLDFSFPKAKIKAKVSAGTYIRSIANDLGKILGKGAYVSSLRRISVGNLDVDLAQNLDDFDSEKKLAIKELFVGKIFVEKTDFSEEIIKKLNNGMEVFGNFDFEKNKEIFIIDQENVSNIVIFDGEKLIPKKKIL